MLSSVLSVSSVVIRSKERTSYYGAALLNDTLRYIGYLSHQGDATTSSVSTLPPLLNELAAKGQVIFISRLYQTELPKVPLI